MENLNKQGGEKTRKTEVKGDSHAHKTPEKKKEEKIEVKKEIKIEQVKKDEKHAHAHEGHEHHEHAHEHKDETTEKKEEVKTEEKKPEKKEIKPRVKKEMAFIKMSGLAISTKHSRDICRFIKGKEVDNAIKELEQVVRMKRAIPMRGEIPHRKGNMMAGRYPITAAGIFIKVLKSLAGNSNVNGVDEPVITLASASWGSRPLRRGGRKFKRTHLYIEAREKKMIKTKKTETKATEAKK